MEVAALIAAFLGDGQLHAARYVKGVAMLGWCGADQHDIGIYYVPTWAFDGRGHHGDLAVCVKCSAALCALAEPR